MKKIRYSLALIWYYIKQLRMRGYMSDVIMIWATLCSVWCEEKKKYWLIRHRLNLRFLEKNIPFPLHSKDSEFIDNYRIWIMWWQGEELMPELVRACVNSVRGHTDKEVVIITKDNYNEYADLSPVVLEKVEKGMITLTNLSDYIRISLLYKNGGLWLDGTVFCSGEIPVEVYESEFFTVHSPLYTGQYNALGRWSGQVLGTNKKYLPLFQYMKAIWEEYWCRYDMLYEYFLIDYVLEYVYTKDKKTKDMIDRVPHNNNKMFWLYGMLNSPFDKAKFDEICKDTYLHKLNWKLYNPKTSLENSYYNNTIKTYL